MNASKTEGKIKLSTEIHRLVGLNMKKNVTMPSLSLKVSGQ